MIDPTTSVHGSTQTQQQRATAMKSTHERIPPLTILPTEDRLFQREVRKFAEEKVRPLVAEMDREGKLADSLLQELFAAGLMAVQIPGHYGGQGGTLFHAVLAIEELARVDPGVAVCVDVQNTLVSDALVRSGTPEQKRRYLPRLASDLLGGFALTEPEAGSDAFSLSTRAEKSSEGYVLNGRKHWITNAAEAGLFLVFANAAPEKGPQGVSLFLVESDADGLTIGKREDKLGIRASSTCELTFEDLLVPPDSLVGGVGDGGRLAMETLNDGRLGISAQMVGLAQGAFDSALAYAQERRQFGRPIATFQGVHFPIAEMATQLESARVLLYNAVRLKEAEAPFVERFRSAAMAKYQASQVAEKVASQAVEIFGGNGYMKEFAVEKFYRDSKIGKIYEGTSNMMLRIIARTYLGKID